MHQHAPNIPNLPSIPWNEHETTNSKVGSLKSAIDALWKSCPPLAQNLEAIFNRLVDADAHFQKQFNEARLLTREQSAALLACSTSKVDRWVANGQLQATYLDRRPRIPLAEAIRFWTSRIAH